MARQTALVPTASERAETSVPPMAEPPVAPTPPDRPGQRRSWRPHMLSVAVLVAGLVVTAGLATVSRVNYTHNERRQLSTQAQLAAAAVAVGPVNLQRILGRATTLASVTGNVRLFEGNLQPPVSDPFATIELFHVVGGTPQLVDRLRGAPVLAPTSPQSLDVLRRAVASKALALTRIATATTQRLGYAFGATTLGQTYVAYAEQDFPANRRTTLAPNKLLSNMTFALYYGKTQTSQSLIETNADHLPIDGDAAPFTVPFGDQVLTGAMIPRAPLLGLFAARLPWLFGGAGLLLTAIMALLAERLARRRAVAEQLAAVTGQLYRTQRGVAETLQTALLPSRLPTPARLSVATRYRGGTEGIEVGGDWYDLIELSEHRLFFTIGDVSGRGLSAATMMSRLRHSIAAYAVEGNDPGMVLTKVGGLIDLLRDGHFATALCGIVDLQAGVLTVSNAGHPPMLLVDGGAAEPVAAPLGPPLGIGSTYSTANVALQPGSILLAYTDGLIERRDEPIDAGIARLCGVAGRPVDLESLLDALLAELLPEDTAEDDTAILGMRWTP